MASSGMSRSDNGDCRKTNMGFQRDQSRSAAHMLKLIPNSVWKLLEAEMQAKREDLRKAHERIDRLTEALARKHEVSLAMPVAERPAPMEIIPASGWFDNKPLPKIQENKNSQ